MSKPFLLNQQSDSLFQNEFDPQLLRIHQHSVDQQRLNDARENNAQKRAIETTLIDFGVSTMGGLNAGRLLAKLCMGDLANIDFTNLSIENETFTAVRVATDFPLEACIGAQYAGWPIQAGKQFAMGSGPIRALRGKEKVLTEYDLVLENESVAVACLESSQLPEPELLAAIQDDLPESVEKLLVAVAKTHSIAGSIQVVARSLETALHKLHELEFDLKTIRSGTGVAPTPPIAESDLKGIGVTNDSILFAGEVELWVETEDDVIAEIGPKSPSSASNDYGLPFYQLFKKNDFDFYKIDPHLFSPARITFNNLKSGKRFVFGESNLKLLRESYGLAE